MFQLLTFVFLNDGQICIFIQKWTWFIKVNIHHINYFTFSFHLFIPTGKCECDEAFIGYNCKVNRSAPPSLTFLPRDGTCNTRGTSSICRQVSVYGDSFVNSEDLKCYAEPVSVSTCISYRNRALWLKNMHVKIVMFDFSPENNGLFCLNARTQGHYVTKICPCYGNPIWHNVSNWFSDNSNIFKWKCQLFKGCFILYPILII